MSEVVSDSDSEYSENSEGFDVEESERDLAAENETLREQLTTLIGNIQKYKGYENIVSFFFFGFFYSSFDVFYSQGPRGRER
jgi:hypothetical protein